MKIEVSQQNLRKMLLDMQCGEVFFDEDGSVCMLIDEGAENDNCRAAVRLEDGVVFPLVMTTKVIIPRDVTLLVNQ